MHCHKYNKGGNTGYHGSAHQIIPLDPISICHGTDCISDCFFCIIRHQNRSKHILIPVLKERIDYRCHQPLLLTAGVLFFLILTGGRITLIASGETFARLTGETDYSLIMVQINGNAGDETVEAIRSAAGDRCRIQDRRDQNTSGTYTAFVACIYGFLTIIALVTGQM